MRVEAGRARKLTLVLDDDEGFAKDTDGEVHARVTRPDETEVLASTLCTSDGDGAYSFTLPAQTQLDEIDVAWTVTGNHARTVTDRVTIVGRRLLSLERLRQDPELEESRVPMLERIRDAVEDKFRTALGFPAVPSPARLSLRATRSRILTLGSFGVFRPLDFYSAMQGTDVITVSDLRPNFGGVEWSDRRLWIYDSIVSLWLSHGFLWTSDGTPPEDLVIAGATYARYLARKNKTPERALRISTEGADILLGSPNNERPTGLPDVDGVLNAHKLDVVV